MATVDIRMPDGTLFRNVPEDTPPEEVRNRWLEVLRSEYSPTSGMTGTEKFLAGAGKAFVDVGRGVGQLVGAVSREDVAESRKLDAPLLESGAAKAGNLVGNIAAVAPTAFIPGANTVAGAAAIGGGLGLIQPSTSTQETLTNVGLGAAVGAGSQYVGQKVAGKAAQAIAKRRAAATAAEQANAVRDQTLKAAREAGYKFPPATINQTSATARAAESLSGKAATHQTAAFRNQSITNRLIRQELGMPKDAPITRAALEGVRERAGQVYEAVSRTGKIVADDQYLDDVARLASTLDDVAKEFPGAKAPSGEAVREMADSLFQPEFDAGAAMKYIRSLREQAKAGFKAVNTAGGQAETLSLARAQWEAAGVLEDMVKRHLQTRGMGQLASRFENARRIIAKAHDAEQALNEATGNIVATKLGGMLRRGKPMGGKFSLIAKAAEAAPEAMREMRSGPGVSALSATLGAGSAMVGAATGQPALAAPALIPVARGLTREAILSPAAQRLAAPSYAPSLMAPRAAEYAGTALEPLSLATLWANRPQQ